MIEKGKNFEGLIKRCLKQPRFGNIIFALF